MGHESEHGMSDKTIMIFTKGSEEKCEKPVRTVGSWPGFRVGTSQM
jgi:hypothetical protein